MYGEALTFVPEAPAYYQKVAAVTSGKSYLIVAENGGKYYLAKPVTSGNFGYLYVEEITVESGDVIYESEIASDENSFVIEGTAGNYTICQSNGKFLYQQDEKYDNFNVSSSPSSGQYWTIEVQSDGTMKITNNDMGKYVQYSSQHSSYGSSADSQGVMPYLFEKVE